MQQAFLHQFTLFSSITLLTLVSCANSVAKNTTQVQSTQSLEPQSSLPSIIAKAKTGHLLSPAQVAKLTKLPIPIVAPTDLPEGFQVVKADGETGKYANGSDDSGYWLEYVRKDNTCFSIRSSKSGPRGLTLKGQVKTKLGAVKIYEETYNNKSFLQSFIPVQGNPIMISPESQLNPKTGNYEQCKALDRAEYERILKSIDIVK